MTETAPLAALREEWEREHWKEPHIRQFIERLFARAEAAEREAEQLLVQLAGCSTAAMGATAPEHRAEKGAYGWSPAYQDTLELRLKYDALHARVAALEAALRPFAAMIGAHQRVEPEHIDRARALLAAAAPA
jgi:hypothetical protein